MYVDTFVVKKSDRQLQKNTKITWLSIIVKVALPEK